MTSPFNGLTPAECERLALLIEECAEVQQAATKILRHGYNSNHPERTETNRADLENEIGDLLAAIHILKIGGDVYMGNVMCAKKQKLLRVQNFLHEQKMRIRI